jgi:ActR/RegA family two-component response regulator
LLPTIRLLAREAAAKSAAILLIDNDTTFRRAAAAGLRARIDAVIEECAGSENEVLAKASALRPAVAAVGWESAGAWVIKCLRSLSGDLSIIALTGSERDNEAIFAAGADVIVAKDRFESELFPLVAALVQNRPGDSADESKPTL